MNKEDKIKDYGYHVVILVAIVISLVIFYGNKIFDFMDYIMKVWPWQFK